MGLTFAGACSGVLPPVALNGVVRSTQINAVRLATPLLLFNADLRKVYRSAGRMLPAFLLGALASLAGALVGTSVVHAPLAAAFAPRPATTFAPLERAPRAEGADHMPFIIPVPSKYDEDSEAYKTAFEGSGAKPNESMRPVSALLVVPVTRDTFDPMSGAFMMSGGEGKQEQNHLVEFSYERLYPYQPAPAAAKLQTYSDPSGERRKELNAKLAEKGPFGTYVDLKKAADEFV